MSDPKRRPIRDKRSGKLICNPAPILGLGHKCFQWISDWGNKSSQFRRTQRSLVPFHSTTNTWCICVVKEHAVCTFYLTCECKSVTYTAGYVNICILRQIMAFCQTHTATVDLRKLSLDILLPQKIREREGSIKWGRCCRCCRSALGCLARWASFNAGTVKWVRDSSVLATRLAASLGRLSQQGLLKDGSVTAAGMPLLCPQRTGHGSHQHYSYAGLGSTVPPGSSNGLWIRGARTQLGYRSCHELYIINILQNDYISPQLCHIFQKESINIRAWY